MSENWDIRLKTGDSERELTGGDYDSFSIRRRDSALADFSMVVVGQADLHKWKGARLIAESDSYFFVGRLESVDSSENTPDVNVAGAGMGVRLTDAGAIIDANNDPTWELLDEYLDTFVVQDFPGVSYNIEPPDVSTVFEKKKLDTVEGVRDQLTEATSFTRTTPLQVRDGAIEQQRICYHLRAEDFEQDSGSTEYTSSEFTGGVGRTLGARNEYFDVEFESEYTIADGRISVRYESDNAPEVILKVNDETFGTVVTSGETSNVGWIELRDFDSELRNFAEGQTVTLRLQATEDSTGSAHFDIITPFDLRFVDLLTFDNEVHEAGGELDGPEEYAYENSFVIDPVDTEANLYRMRVESTWDDTSNGQAIDVSNNGDVWEGQERTDTTEWPLAGSYGYSAHARFTLSHTDAVRNDQTPRTGFESQRMSGWEVFAWGNDLVVSEEQSYDDDNHLLNIQTLADEAGMDFYIRHETEDEMFIDLFHPGQRTRSFEIGGVGFGVESFGTMPFGSSSSPLPSDYDSKETNSSEENYYNRVIVRGAEREDGTRPKGVAVDEAEIETRESADIEPAERTFRKTNPRLESRAVCQARANRLLDEFVENNELGGSIDGLSNIYAAEGDIDPAVEFAVADWEGEVKLEQLTINAIDGTLDLDFEGGQNDQILKYIRSASRRVTDIERSV